jgi:hypothetical protein
MEDIYISLKNESGRDLARKDSGRANKAADRTVRSCERGITMGLADCVALIARSIQVLRDSSPRDAIFMPVAQLLIFGFA